MKQSEYRAWADMQVAASEARFDAKFRDYMASGASLQSDAVEAWIDAGCPMVAGEVQS